MIGLNKWVISVHFIKANIFSCHFYYIWFQKGHFES